MTRFLPALLVVLAATGIAAAQPYPTATNVVPADKAAGVPLNAHIIVGLTVPQGYSLTPLKLFNGATAVSGSIKFGGFPGGVTGIFPVFGWVTFAPDKLLDPNTAYTIQVDAPSRPTYTSTFTTGTSADTTPLRLVGMEPASGTNGIDRSAPLVLHFSRPIDPLTLQNAPFMVREISGGYAYTIVPVISNDGLSLSFSLPPSGSGFLPLGHAYRFEFPNPMGQDWLGNTLASPPDPITFTTFPNPAKDGPQFTGSAPGDGDTGIAINSSILMVLDRPLAKLVYDNGVTLTVNGNPVKCKLDTTIAGPSALVIQPSLLFPPNATVTLTVDGLIDTFGVAQASPITVTFQTGSAPDTTAIQLAFPQNALLPRSAPVRGILSRPLDPAAVAISSAQVYAADNYYNYEAVKVRLDSDRRTLTLDTGGPLPAGAYRVAVNIPFDRIQAKAVSLPLYFTVTGDNDIVAPTILAVSPPDGQAGAPLGTVIQFVFSETVVAASVTDKAFRFSLQDGTEVPGTFTLTGAAARFQPKTALAPSTGYQFELTGLVDYSGNALPPIRASFTTGDTDPTEPFKVLSIIPATGSKGIDPNTPIVATFNRAVNPASVYAQDVWALRTVTVNASAGAFTVSGATVTFTPAFPLPLGNWGVSVLGVTDLAGNVTAAAYTIFDTASPPDTGGPAVVSVSPADGGAVLFQSPYVTLTFSKPLDPKTVTPDNFRVYSSRGNLQSKPSFLAGSTTQVRIDFAAEAGSLVTVYVNPSVLDVYGNAATPFRSTVKVSNVFAPTAGASVVLARPSGVRLPAGTSIDLAFNAPVDRASVERGLIVSASGVTVPGSVSWTSDSMALTFTPTAPLPYGASIEVAIVYPAQDAAGNPVSYDASAFQVEPAPPTPEAELNALFYSIVFPNQDLPLDTVLDILFASDLPDGFVKPESGKVWFGGWDNNGTPTGAYVDASATQIRPRVVRIKAAAPLQPSTNYTFAFDLGSGQISRTTLSTGTTAVTPVPTIVGYGPTGQAVALNAKIAITISNPVSLLALQGGVRLQSGPRSIPALIAVSGQLVTLTPLGLLFPNADYTVVVSGLEDLAGHQIPDRSWAFHTTDAVELTPPAILRIDPVGDGVSPASKVSITFSKPVIATPLSSFSVTDAGLAAGSNQALPIRPLPGTLQFSADQRVLTFTPAQPLPLGHLMQVIPPSTIDFQGNGLSQNSNPSYATFRVGYAAATPPSVTAVTPADGSAAMPLNARIQARFDQPVASTSLGGVTLYENETPVNATIVLEADGHTVTAVPARFPSAYSTYRFVLAGVTSAGDSVPMAAPFQSTFRMGATLDSVTPTCRAFPNPAQTEVPVGVTVRFYCSEPLNPLTVNGSSISLFAASTANVREVSISLADGGQTIVIVPAFPLAGNVAYSVFAPVTDLAGNPVNLSTYFTTVSGLPQPATVLVAVDPSNGALAVPPAVKLQLLFNLPVDLPGGAAAFQLSSSVGPVSGTLSVSNTVISLQPTRALTPGNYHYQVTGITDAAGKTLDPVAGDFTVVAADPTNFRITGTTPSYGAVGVAINSPITLNASKPISAVSAAQLKVVSNFGPVSGVWITNGNTTTFTPSGTYPGASQVSVSGNITDLTGVYASTYVNFTTAANPETKPFTVESVLPADGSRIRAGGINILVRFSKPSVIVDPDFAQVFVGSSRISGSSFSTISDDRQTLNFQLGLPADSDVVVTFGSGIRDFSGNPLPQVTLHYRTASAAESNGPAVSSFSPPAGALNADVNAHIQVVFTHPMVLSSVQAGLTVTNAGSVIPGTITADSSGTTFDFAPSVPYQSGQSVEVIVANTIYDTSGVRMQPFNWQFTTAALAGSAVHAVEVEVSTRAIDVRFDGPLRECPATLYLHSGQKLIGSRCTLTQSDQIRVVPETSFLRAGARYVLVIDADQELPLQVPAEEDEPGPFAVDSMVTASDGIHLRFTKSINTVTARAGIRVRNAAGEEIRFSILTVPDGREIVIAAAGAAVVELEGLESRAGDLLPKVTRR